MMILRNLLISSARRLAADPRVREKAAEVFTNDVRPRLDAAKEELREIAGETDPREDLKGFAHKLKNRFLDINNRD